MFSKTEDAFIRLDKRLCMCGCGELLDIFDKKGRPRFYIKDHQNKARQFSIFRCAKFSELKLCKCNCGTLIPARRKNGRPRSYRNGHNWRGKFHTKEAIKKIIRCGRAHWNYRGGRIMSSGYIYVLAPKGYVSDRISKRGYIPEHTFLMEQSLGRKLAKGEVVNHINHIRTDNRLENLQLITSQSDHNILHNQERRETRILIRNLVYLLTMTDDY